MNELQPRREHVEPAEDPPAVGEDLQSHVCRHLQRLPGQVLVDELLGSSGQRAQGLLSTRHVSRTAESRQRSHDNVLADML